MDVLDFPLADASRNAVLPQPYPYASSIASSASSSSSSIFSVESSQSSISSVSATSVDVIWENEDDSQSANKLSGDCASQCFRTGRGYVSKATETTVPLELRKNPRRSFRAVNNASGCPLAPPSLVRQSDRKLNFVDSLVDSTSQIVETIWPLSVVAPRNESVVGCKGVLPLRTFIQETLRRSRTSYSTLQVALYYIIKIKSRVPRHDFTMEQPRIQHSARAMQCGRRMFLAALILASKYLQDRNYSARAWSKISGLNTAEINQNELIFLEAVDWRLHISEPIFQRWTDVVLKYTPSAGGSSNGEGLCWRSVIPSLTPDLDTVGISPVRQGSIPIQDLLSPAQTPSPCRTPVSACQPPTNNQTPTCPQSGLPTTEDIGLGLGNTELPPLPKLGLLTTPHISPQTGIAATPAASVGVFGSRRPSMCSAMSQVQSLCAQRTVFEHRSASLYTSKPAPTEAYPLARRSSLARSSSSTSSPESMVSDVPSLTSSSSRSTRSSRSSSISSVTSATCAPAQSRLVARATRRCGKMQTNFLKENRKNLSIAPAINEASDSELCATPEPMSAGGGNMPDFSNFSLGTPVDMAFSAQEAAQGLCELSGAMPRSNSAVKTSPQRGRKRGRTSSDDMNLYHNVRQFMSLDSRKNEDDGNVVLPDSRIADSFFYPQPKAAQPPPKCSFSTAKRPLPLALPKNTGSIKRVRCGTEATRSLWGIEYTPTNAMVDIIE